MLTLSACATTTGSGEIKPVQGADTYCQIAVPIGWSSQDTDQTIREVKAHNAVWLRLCKRE